MSTMKVDADISDFIAKSRQVEAGLQAQATAIKDVIKVTTRYNEKGEETSGILKGLVDANHQAEVSYRNVGGALVAGTTVISKTTDALKKLREEQQKVASAANVMALDKGIIVKGRFKGEDLQQLEKVKSAIAALNSTVVNPKIIGDFLAKLREGKGIEATGTLAKLRDQLQKLVTIENRLATKATNKELSRKTLGRFTEFTEKELPPLKFGIDEDELKTKAKQSIRNALENIREEIKLDPTVNITRIRKILDQLKANPMQTFDDRGDQKIANQLSRILNVYKQIEEAKKRQANISKDQLDLTTKTAAQVEKENKAAAAMAQRIRSQMVAPQQARLGGISPGLNINEGRLSVLGRKIAELGQQANLSADEVMGIFDAVNKGDFASIDGKYNRLTQKIIQYNKLIEQELKKLAKGVEMDGGIGGPGGGGRKPGDLAPDGPTMGKAREFMGIMEKVKTSLQFFFIYKGFSTLQEGLANATTAAAMYEDKVSLIRTISQDAQLSTAAWTEGLSRLSSKLGVEFADAANAAYDAVSNQIAQGADVFKFVEQAGNLAKTTNSSLQESTNLLSSVINTYGNEAGSIEDISAKLFKTIDRGRIVASELSNTFGRVAFTAKDAGVSFEEVNAMLALLTRSGVTTDDAMTLVNNLLLQIRKPSEDLKQVFDEMGIGANGNAIKIKGLTGILKELQSAASAGKVDLSKIFPEIRAERAATFLLGRTDELQNEIKAIGEGARETFQKAIDIRDEPIIQKINKIKNTIQNALATTVGEGINKTVVGLAEKVTGTDINSMVKDQKSLEEAIEKVQFAFSRAVRIAASFGAGLLALKGSMTAIAVVTELVNAATAKKIAFEAAVKARMIENIALTRQQAIAEQQLASARGGAGMVGRFGGVGGLAIAGVITAISAYQAYKAAVVDTYSTAQQSLDEFVKKAREDDVGKILNKNVDELGDIRRQMGDATRPVLQASAKELGNVSNNLLNIRAASAKVGESLKSNFVGYLDIAKNRIQEAERAFSQLTSRIESAGKAQLGFRQKLDDIIFGNQQQYATDPQFLEVTRNQIKKLTSEAKRLYASNTEEGVTKGRELFDKLADLQNQYSQRRMQMRVKEQEAAGGGVVLYDPTEDLREQNGLLKLKEALEARTTEKLKEEKTLIETNIALQKSKLDEFQKSLTKFEEFSAFDAAGQAKPEFRTKTGQTDVAKIQKEFDELSKAVDKGMAEVDKANAKTGDKSASVAERVNITKLIAERRKMIAEEITATSKQKELIDLQGQLIQGSENKVKALGMEEKKYDDYNKKLQETINLLEQLQKASGQTGGDFKSVFQQVAADSQASTKLGREFSGAIKDMLNSVGLDAALNTGGKGRFTGDLGDIPQRMDEARQKLAEASKAKVKVDGKEVLDIDTVRKAANEYAKIFEEMKAKVNSNIDALNTALKDGKASSISEEASKRLNDIVQKMNTQEESLGRLQKMLDDTEKAKPAAGLIEKARADLTDFQAQMKDFNLAPEQIANNVSALIGGVGNVAEKSGVAIDGLTEKMKKLIELQAGGNIKLPGAEGEPARKAYGGPIGHDNVPLWAQAGEIMANKQASTDYYSQIMAMNNTSRVPQYFNQGGMVQGGGDTFNITVNESKTPQLTARQISKAVRSNQRRG